ncbi:hypothetical protein [Leisingera aquaemixtae]|uniref:hypothetical protein n=1 Tax=Leisingera aquaemixtae TaxID=1396826 RepID=UPI0021A2A142|nr:hypothetical protein [Leisingera aquaemixtae]UWQ47284.1 hypothetical protein K3719_07940 [Leisingera aquaemixtae]
MQKLSLLGVMLSAPVAVPKPVEPSGQVIPRAEIMQTIRLPHPILAWDTAAIELHQHTDGMWMWATQASLGGNGYGYSVGPKWGNFAHSRADALWLAADEIERRVAKRDDSGCKGRIAAWCVKLKQEAR